MNNFGEKIKILRTRKKLKQDDIASVLNLSRAQISNLEAGRRNVTLKQLEKLCEYFKVDITYFMLSENTDECLDLIEKARILFGSKELTNMQKEDLFISILKIYLDTKEEMNGR
jgi:transcriptional regulator with XRE-family HTH domain